MKIPFFNKSDKPVIRKRSEHCVSRANIDPCAIKVLYRLHHAGYTAYLVGGGVRDLLLGRNPKDFDVGTNAKPNELRHIFRNCFLIGKRFRLAHIVFGKTIIETSTFRRQPDPVPSEYGMYQREDNTFGTPAEDAKRRDFTVNGIFYDIATFSLIDYVGGLKDLEKKILRCIGNPEIRFQEDPVRMMRAVKFASRLNFTIERSARKAIIKYHGEILKAAPPRIFEEVTRLFSFHSAEKAFRLLWELGLMQDLFPDLSLFIKQNGESKSALWQYLAALDQEPESEEDASPVLRLAALVYARYKKAMEEEFRGPGRRPPRGALLHTISRGLTQNLKIPHGIEYGILNLLDSVRRFDDPPESARGQRFLRTPYFPEALRFLKIVLTAEGQPLDRAECWRLAFGKIEKIPRDPTTEEDPENPPRRRRRRRHPSRRNKRESVLADETTPEQESQS